MPHHAKKSLSQFHDKVTLNKYCSALPETRLSSPSSVSDIFMQAIFQGRIKPIQTLWAWNTVSWIQLQDSMLPVVQLVFLATAYKFEHLATVEPEPHIELL